VTPEIVGIWSPSTGGGASAVRLRDVARDQLLPLVRIVAVATSAEYKEGVSTLRELQERRAFECRLTPDRALETLDDAEEFLRERGVLTLMPTSSLPSLFGACHEEPYQEGGRGFGAWPRTKYPWGASLGDRKGTYATKLHRGKTLFLSREVAALADPICRAEIARMESADREWARLLRHLNSSGPSLLEDLQRELELEPRELKALRAPLERCGAVVARPIVVQPHRHTSELARWDQVFTSLTRNLAELAGLVVAGVRAAVVVPDKEPRKWFSWTWRWDDELVDRLVAEGRLAHPEEGWLWAP
jgi:hypothetical protein